jgi:hypothetical protein
MNKLIIAITVALLIYTSFAFAIEVTNINNPNTINDATNPQIQANAEILAKINALDQKMSNYATKSDVQGLLEAHLNITNKIIDNFFKNFIIYAVIICLGTLGLGFGTWFFFKSKGRL